LDYDFWLGPAPYRPYNKNRVHYNFRFFWDYSGGQMTNLGAHSLDIVQWYTGFSGPVAVFSSGGRFALEDDDGETPDTQDALFEFPGFTALWSHREASVGRRAGAGLEFFGTKGSLHIDRSGYQVFADNRIEPDNAIPTFQGQPEGGPVRRSAQPAQTWIEPRKESGSAAEQFDLHVRNFLDCIKTRRTPIAPLEDGHRVATACHLANLSLRLGRKLRWDPQREQVIGDPEANAMLTRPYRAPWDGVLLGLGVAG
jgi:predicted dehydrogenase